MRVCFLPTTPSGSPAGRGTHTQLSSVDGTQHPWASSLLTGLCRPQGAGQADPSASLNPPHLQGQSTGGRLQACLLQESEPRKQCRGKAPCPTPKTGKNVYSLMASNVHAGLVGSVMPRGFTQMCSPRDKKIPPTPPPQTVVPWGSGHSFPTQDGIMREALKSAIPPPILKDRKTEA